MSGTVCLDVFEQMGVENAKQVGWMLGWLTLLAYNFLGDSGPHIAGLVTASRLTTARFPHRGHGGRSRPEQFLNSACYRFADFIFAPRLFLCEL